MALKLWFKKIHSSVLYSFTRREFHETFGEIFTMMHTLLTSIHSEHSIPNKTFLHPLCQAQHTTERGFHVQARIR
jgi:hypothetical protein